MKKFVIFLLITVSLLALSVTLCAAESDFSAISSTSTHASAKFDENYLIDGNYSKTASLWVSSDNSRPTTSAETNLTPKTDVILTLTLAKTQDVSGVVLWPHMGYNNEEAGQYFPRGFDISTSSDGGATYTLVKSVKDYTISGTVTGQYFSFEEQKNVTHVKVQVTQMGWYTGASSTAYRNAYAKLSEIALYDSLADVKEQANAIKLNQFELDYTDGKLVFPELNGYNVEIASSSNTSAIALNGTINKNATENVQVVFKIIDKNNSAVSTLTKSFTFELDAQKTNTENVAITAASASTNHATYNSDKLWDGNRANAGFWAGDGKYTGDIDIIVTLASETVVSYVDMYMAVAGNGKVNAAPSDFAVYTSLDGNVWSERLIKSNQTTGAANTANRLYLNGTEKAKYVKITIFGIVSGGNTHIGELEVFGINNFTDHKLVAESISANHIEVDYTNKRLILPIVNGYTVSIHSTSDNSVIGLDGSVDISKKATAWVTLALTSNANSSIKVNTKAIDITVLPAQSIVAEKKISSINADSNHSKYNDTFLIDGSVEANSFWASADGAHTHQNIEIVADMGALMPISCVDVYPARNTSKVLAGAKDFTIYVSETGAEGTWVECLVKAGQKEATDGSAQRLWLNGMPEARFVKLHITKFADGAKNVHIGEIKIYACDAKTAEECVNELKIAPIAYGDSKINISGVSEMFNVTITNSSNAQIIDTNGKITYPANDTEVTLTVMVESKLDGKTATKSFTVTVKSEKKLLAEKIAKSVDFVELPANDATAITIPTIDNADYEISLVKSDNESVIALNGSITRPEETMGVYLTFRITLKSDSSVYADTKPLLVPIYKPYAPIAMTNEEIAAVRADFEAKGYGVFVHYVSEYYNPSYGTSSTKYVDGTPVLTVDDLANGFNAEQFAKDMHDFGAEWVVFTCWHGDARTLFPSMTNKRWRDDRREIDENGNWVEEYARKTYSDKDLIDELITELDKYGIELHLYVHTSDGTHDFTAEDKKLTGAGVSANNYELWNKYNNELFYELCERYRDRIKGLWIDGHLAGLELSNTTKRLEEFYETCTSFYPAMLLTLNGGLDSYDYDNTHNGNPTTTHSVDRHWGKVGDSENGISAYMSWEVNPGSKIDYTTLRYSKNQTAAVIGNGNWFAGGSQTAKLNLADTADMFRYIVALKSKTTMGGFLASTGFYPVREQDLIGSYPIAGGDYWRYGVRDQLVSLNADYIAPVAESIKNTIPSTAYVSHNDDYVAMLEWGVATESRDGKYVYLHVLNAPEGNTLTIPKTADGTKLIANAIVIGFDGSRTAINVTETNNGYSITLPDTMNWSEVDTVIRAERETASFNVNAEEINFGAAGESFVLEADADKVIFVSSDESVAIVDQNGIVTAIGEGTATITVVNGYNANNIDKTDLDAYNPNYTIFVEVTVLFDGSHTHNFGSDWVYDGNTHYHLCVCGAKSDMAVHTGGSATCKIQAVCDVCKASYGELSHHGGMATCSAKAICATCGETYGDYAPHAKFVFDSFSGRFVCVDCGDHCEHTSFANGVCNDCGFTCTHDWQYNGNKATCSVCGKVCTSHGTSGLDFKCATCGYDNGAENFISAGGKTITDGALMLNKYHKFDISFGVTFGSADTVVNVKDESRSDNIYFSATESANNVSEYFSVITWVNNQGAGNSYLNFVSLWLDTSTSKLYLVKNNDKNTKICEITAGVEYVFDVEVNPTGGKFNVTVSRNGTACGTLSGTFNAITKQLVGSQLRFGEAVNAKQLHVQKIAFNEIQVDMPKYLNGICVDCGVECNHIFNAGGHCIFCTEFGNAITFEDGANGGGNIYDTDNNGKLDNNGDKLTDGNRVYLSQSGSYKQTWDYRDESGSLLGRSYVFSGTFNFSEWKYVPENGAGTTRLLIWADGDVNASSTKFALYMFGNNGKLEIGPDEKDASTRFELELNRDYDIRVAVRSEETSDGKFAQTADIYIDGKLMWTRSFNLTAQKGISIRIGDHTARQTQVKYSISEDFGIHCLDSNISFIGTQEKENANYEWDTKYDLRFIFALDDLYLSDVGVKVEAEMSGGTMYEDANGTLTASSSRTVLNGVMANGKVYKPGACGAGYGGNYLALAITDIPLDATATYTFTLTPYVTNHGAEPSFSETSHKITVSFTDYKMNIAYEKAE